MSGTDRDVERARENALRARLQLARTMGEILDRLHPRTLVGEVFQEVRERGHDMAEQAVELARSRPATTSAIAAGMIALFAREPIWRALATLISRRREASKREQESEPEHGPTPAIGEIPQHYEEVA